MEILMSGDDDEIAEVLNEGPQGELPLSHTFIGLAQGTWDVSGSLRIDGHAEWTTLADISCTVAGGL